MHVITASWNWNRWVAAVPAALLGAFGWTDVARADAVTDWYEITAICFVQDRDSSTWTVSFLDLSMVQTAVYDAVQNLAASTSRSTQVTGASGSPEAAAAKASHDRWSPLCLQGGRYRQPLQGVPRQEGLERRRSGGGGRGQDGGRGHCSPGRRQPDAEDSVCPLDGCKRGRQVASHARSGQDGRWDGRPLDG